MTRIHRALAILLAGSIFLGTPGLAGRFVPLVPAGAKSVTLLTGGKERTYYALTKRAPVTLQVDGPGQLVVFSRLSFPGGAEATGQYTIKVLEGKNTLKVQTTQTDRSDASFKGSAMRPGKSRKFSLNVPEDTHTFTFQLEGDNAGEAALRFLFGRKKGSGSLVSLEPLAYDKIVTAMVEEKLIAYYVASKERSVQLRIVGPTRLRVSTRLNYDAKMKGDQKYAVTLSEGGRQIVLKSLATTKSVGIEYQEWRDVVPGKVNAFFVDVPKGEHTYRVALTEGLAHSVSLKFSIPKKDLSNEAE